jgi:hypothetical protein
MFAGLVNGSTLTFRFFLLAFSEALKTTFVLQLPICASRTVGAMLNSVSVKLIETDKLVPVISIPIDWRTSGASNLCKRLSYFFNA